MGKQDRQYKVLLGLVEHYIQTGKPVGSNTLKDAGFGDLSSATIRNYFANLEEKGYLIQSHLSGGRIPTYLAYREYAQSFLHNLSVEVKDDLFQNLRQFDSREIALFLQEAAETLSKTTQCAVFLSAPRFDHDFVVNLKLVSLDAFRCLGIIVTDFGTIQTELLHIPEKLSAFAIKRIENYFHWRLTGLEQPENLKPTEEALAQIFYNELMLRYIVRYSNFIDEDIYRTGFSHLLSYGDMQEAGFLTSALTLFENFHSMRLLLKESRAMDRLKFWIGDDLIPYAQNPNCAVIASPYYVNQKPVGAVGVLGPVRLPYRTLFRSLRLFSESVSEALTRNIYKFKIDFCQPMPGNSYLQKEGSRLVGQSRFILLEDKRVSTNS